MKNNILISICIPTYNREKYLSKCIDSVIMQKWFSDWDLEIIISDNDSNDNTESIVKKYQIKYNNIKYSKNNNNIWFINNFNELLDLWRWEYFILLSDDDKFYDNYSLIKLYNWIKKFNLDACYWKSKRFYNENNIEIYENNFKENSKIEHNWIYLNNYEDELKSHTIWFWWILYKKYSFKYNNKAWLYCDWFINLEYLKNNKNIWIINEFTFLYRIHKNQSVNHIWFFADLKMYYNILKELKIKNWKIIYLYTNRIIYLIKNNIVNSLIYITKKLNIYSFLSPFWRKYMLKQK